MVDFLLRFVREILILFAEMSKFLLLGMTVAGLMSVFIKKEMVVRHVGGHNLGSVLKSALLGVPLPLCSCGVVPTASYLKKYGASRPAVMSFLISTPQTGVDSLSATWGMLGPLFAVFRAVTALITGMIGGIVSWIFGRESETEETDTGTAARPVPESWRGKAGHFLNFAFRESVDDIAGHFVVGLAIAALIQILIPADFFQGRVVGSGLPAMLLMVAIGVPMYICSTSSIPIAVALILKGLSPGAAYVFLVAGPATNAATIAVLTWILGKKNTAFYVGTIIAGSLVFGLIMDGVINTVGWSFAGSVMGHGMALTTIDYLAAVLFAGLLLISFGKRFGIDRLFRKGASTLNTGSSGNENKENIMSNIITLNIEGMTCNHCKATVEDALQSVSGTDNVEVDLQAQRAVIRGSAVQADLEKAVTEAGYKVS